MGKAVMATPRLVRPLQLLRSQDEAIEALARLIAERAVMKLKEKLAAKK
jgi:hypothetical protein